MLQLCCNSKKRMVAAVALLAGWRGFPIYIQGDFFNWPSPENVSRLAPPKFAWTGPPLIF